MAENRQAGAFGTEGGRRPTGVPNAAGASELSELQERLEGRTEETLREHRNATHATQEQSQDTSQAPWDSGALVFLDEETAQENSPVDLPTGLPRLTNLKKGRRLVRKPHQEYAKLSPEQRLLLLDTWQRSGLTSADFANLVGISKHTLYGWKRKFKTYGPEGLMDEKRGAKKGSKLPELTKRTILMIKEANPEYGCQRISDMLLRGPALPASANAVARVLHEAGYETEEVATSPHGVEPKRFERARPNQLWQTDIFTFTLKRQNRRIYLIAFLDDNSRFLVSWGLYGSCSTAMVVEVLRAGISSYGAPEEVLTDNGPQYVTWRGKSAFAKELERRGIRHVVAKPKHPQTLGKIERYWGTLWGECVEAAIFLDLEDARKRIALFVDYYNFHRVHQGIDGLVPADRFFEAAPEVLKTLRSRVAANALELARNGMPKKKVYVSGRVGDKSFSIHGQGERVIMTQEGEHREEVELITPLETREETEELPKAVSAAALMPEEPMQEENTPGVSILDEMPDPQGGSGKARA
jgi:transposase InsO family protein